MSSRISTTLHDTGLAMLLHAATDDPDVTRMFAVPLTPGREGRELRDAHFVLDCTGGKPLTPQGREHFEQHRTAAASGCFACKLLGRLVAAEGRPRPSDADYRKANIVLPGVTGEGLARAERDREARRAAREARAPRPLSKQVLDPEELF